MSNQGHQRVKVCSFLSFRFVCFFVVCFFLSIFVRLFVWMFVCVFRLFVLFVCLFVYSNPIPAWMLYCYASCYCFAFAFGIDAIYGWYVPFGAYGSLDEVAPSSMQSPCSEKA